MQRIATERNLVETTFLVKDGERRHIHWFTPTGEVPLCEHARSVASGSLWL